MILTMANFKDSPLITSTFIAFGLVWLRMVAQVWGFRGDMRFLNWLATEMGFGFILGILVSILFYWLWMCGTAIYNFIFK